MAYSAVINRSGLIERQYPYQRTAKEAIEAGMAVATGTDVAGNTEIPLAAGTVVPVQWRIADVKQYNRITDDETDSYSYAVGDLLYSLDPVTNDLYNVYIDNTGGGELVLAAGDILDISTAVAGAFIVALGTTATTVVGTRPFIVAEDKTIPAPNTTGRVVARFVNV